jgi:mannose-6-phosphate isomerase class I
LYDIIHHNPEEFLGNKVVSRFGKQLPLVKILTPRGRLSVQFHDSKNELWIVTKTDRMVAGGRPWIIIGFSQESVKSYGNDVTKHYKKSLVIYGDALNNLIDFLIQSGDEYLLNKRNDVAPAASEAIRNKPGSSELAKMVKDLNTARKRLDTFYNREYVEVGEVVPIPSRTLHALGPGVQVVEPQISGPTQSLEDGSTYPIRYAFPGYPRKEAKKLLDIDRAGEMHSHVSEKMVPVILRETENAIVERLPGGFEDRGLSVHRIRLEKDAEFKQALTSFHSLVVTYGKAHVVIKDKKYEIPKALPDGQMLFVPASAKNYIMMATETSQIIDTFTPI